MFLCKKFYVCALVGVLIKCDIIFEVNKNVLTCLLLLLEGHYLEQTARRDFKVFFFRSLEICVSRLLFFVNFSTAPDVLFRASSE